MSDTTQFFTPMTRRHWMGHLASTALGIPAIQFFSSLEAGAQQLRKTNRSCIVLWMGGGPSHLDIWDLKPDSEKNGGPFKPIDTSAPGVKITEHLPKVAKQMHHLSIIRSLDSKEGNHDRGTYMMHTGYTPNPTVVHPGFGSYCAVELGERLRTFDLPHCIAINSPSVGAGFLGMSYAPFVVQNPNAPIANLKPPHGCRRVADGAPAAHARPGGEPVRRHACKPGSRRSQVGLREDASHDELPTSRHLQPRARAGRGARCVRPRVVRLGLPDGAGGWSSEGSPMSRFRWTAGTPTPTISTRCRSGSSPSSTRGCRPWSPTWPSAGCSIPRRSSGWASSAARRGSIKTRAAITGREAGRSSSAAAA